MLPENKLNAVKKYVLGFQEIDRGMVGAVGGKGANLGELSRIEGIRVPEGFCVTAEAYKKVTQNNEELNCLLDELTGVRADDREHISSVSAKIRSVIEAISIPGDIADEVRDHLARSGVACAYAVRSSATAEDLPGASFAGQQDTYLNIIGREAVLHHISKCWASLFTERAVVYRIQNGFDHREVTMPVVVQQMVFPEAAGILFTADPVTGNRKVVSIDAGFGLGEAMVSGLVNADSYKVRNGSITDKRIPAKKLAVHALKGGGTKEQEVAPELQSRQALTDEQILQLEQKGRKIEAHFGSPQDIEWCLANGTFYIVQSRPITTLFPVPGANDAENRVYISVGHQQMMTDAMKPLGISFWQLTAARPMYEAGGRLFVDITALLASPQQRKMIIDLMGEHDPLIKDAVVTIVERGDFIKPLPADSKEERSNIKSSAGKSAADILSQTENDPAIASELIARNEAAIDELKQNIATRSGTDVFDLILADITGPLKKSLTDPQNMRVIMAAIDASAWLNENMMKWLGEKNAADTLSLSVPNNITSEMGLALMDVADVVRPYPEVVDYLQQVKDEGFLDGLAKLNGGADAREAIYAFLDKYGMRCAGEIDITMPRWSERPGTLVPTLLSNIRSFEHGAGKRKFEQGRQAALKKEQELLVRLKQLQDGNQKADETKQMISLLRNFIGYREYPKYGMISRYWVYKQAILNEAETLVQANVIQEKEDIYYLTFEELREAVRAHKVNQQIVSQRKEKYRLYKKLTPPRVITSDGEIITGKYNRENLPPGAMAGLAVSSGVVEGRARVILNMEDADMEDGDILVTSFTDPSWTPLFVSVAGLVTEVGGLMTHGAVIAREYGLPAVVGVENATRLIKDGQRIRVNGTDGYVAVL